MSCPQTAYGEPGSMGWLLTELTKLYRVVLHTVQIRRVIYSGKRICLQYSMHRTELRKAGLQSFRRLPNSISFCSGLMRELRCIWTILFDWK